MDVQNQSVPQGISAAAPQAAAPNPDKSMPKAGPVPEAPNVGPSVPSSPTQTALIGAAALSEGEDLPATQTAGPSAAERLLKPYGINMLPEKQDAPPPDGPAERQSS